MGKASAPSPSRVERLNEQGVDVGIGDDPDTANDPKFLRMRIGGKTTILDFESLGPGDDSFSRSSELGFPISPLLSAGQMQFASDVLLMLLCLARRRDGEPNLTYARVVGEYPSFKALGDAMDEDSIQWLNAAGQVLDENGEVTEGSAEGE